MSRNNNAQDVRAVEQPATAAQANRWAQAFHKKMLSHHDASVTTEPQPSRRPAPGHTGMTTTTVIQNMDNQNKSPLRPQPGSHSTALPLSKEIRMPQSVSAVAVHPPMSRQAKRTAVSAAAASRSASLPSAASSSCTSGSYVAVPYPAPTNGLTTASEQCNPAPLRPPPAMADLRNAANGLASPPMRRGAASATAMTPRQTSPLPTRGGDAPLPASQAYAAPHKRPCPAGNHTEGVALAKPLSQLHLQQMQPSPTMSANAANGGGHHTPLASAATPHVLAAYASSPFFQRVTAEGAEATPAAAVHQGSDAPAVESRDSWKHTRKSADEGEADSGEDSMLLQQVTPISRGNGGVVSQQDSQLLSQPRESIVGAAAGIAVPMDDAAMALYQDALKGYYQYADPEADIGGTQPDYASHPPAASHRMFEGASQTCVPPEALSSPYRPYTASGVASEVATAAAYEWADSAVPTYQASYNPLPLLPHSQQQQQQPVYYSPNFPISNTASSAMDGPCGMQSEPPLARSASKTAATAAFASSRCSPYTPADMTRLSTTPGGLTGSHSVTLNTTSGAHLHSTMTPGGLLMLGQAAQPAAPSSANGSAAVSFLQPPLQADRSAAASETSPFINYYNSSSSQCYLHSPSPTGAAAGAGGYRNGGRLTVGLPGNQVVPTVSGVMTAATSKHTASMSVTSGLSGVALEKQLLHASKAELVQILLELGSCNPEASRFIDAKAFFFAFRHEHREAAVADGDGGASVNDAKALELQTKRRKEDTAAEVACTTEETVTNTAHQKLERSSTAGNIARCIFPAGLTEEDDGEANVKTATGAVTFPFDGVSAKQQGSTTHAAPPLPMSRRMRPEERPFCAETHPCMRWYGACRNATSCVYASLPRNLCLNWVRGACVAHSDCSGVHRLPVPCPVELKRIYLLNHGLSRSEAGMEAVLSGASGMKSHSGPVVTKTSDTFRAASKPKMTIAATGMGVRCESAAKTEASHPRNSSKDREDEGQDTDNAMHTPHNQSIHKESLRGGDSTPHRHPQGRLVSVTESSVPDSPHQDGKESTAVDVHDRRLTMDEAGTDEPDCQTRTDPLCEYSEAQHSGAASPAGSSCSTVEAKTATTDSVSRCLGPQFECATSPSPDDAMTAAQAVVLLGKDLSSLPVHPSEAVKVYSNDRHSPLVLSPLRATKPPLRSVAAAVQQTQHAKEVEEEEDGEYRGASAPAAGTRTRMQSPVYADP